MDVLLNAYYPEILVIQLHIDRGADLRNWYILLKVTQILLKQQRASKQRKHLFKNIFEVEFSSGKICLFWFLNENYVEQ